MTEKQEKPKEPTWDPAYIRLLSEKVYRILLANSAGGNDPEWRKGEADRMIAKDNEAGRNGERLFSGRAGQLDHLTRAYLEVLGFKP